MSYARFSDDSDVYVYTSIFGGITCHYTDKSGESGTIGFDSPIDMAEWLIRYRAKGNKVRKETIELLLEEAEEDCKKLQKLKKIMEEEK